MFKLTIFRKDVKKDPTYKKAADYMESFAYDNLRLVNNADWVLEHAKKRFDLMQENVREIDEKADTVIRYIGLIVGAGVLFVGAFSGNLGSVLLLGIIVASILLTLSAFFALLVRKPTEVPHPPTVQDVFEYLNRTKSALEAHAKLALVYGRAIAALVVIGRIKGQWLYWAHVFLFFVLFAILCCLCIHSFSSLVSDGGSSSLVTQSSLSSSSSVIHSSLSPLPESCSSFPLPLPDSCSSLSSPFPSDGNSSSWLEDAQ